MRFRTWAATIAVIVIPLEGALLATNWRSHSCPYGEAIRIPLPFEHISQRAWSAEIPELERLADNSLDAFKSRLVICENDRVLGPAHSHHRDIAKSGQGRFSHWGTGLVFSTSDNSNPNTNGRSYLAIRIRPDTSLTAPPALSASTAAAQPASEPPAPPVSEPPAPPVSELPGPPIIDSQAQPAALPLPREVAGQIVKLDKASQQISLQREKPDQSSSVTEHFLLDHEPAYDILQAGDQVALTIEQHDGVWKVTRYSRLQ